MVPGVPRSASQIPAQPLDAFLDHLLLREREGRDAGPHLAVDVEPRPTPAARPGNAPRPAPRARRPRWWPAPRRRGTATASSSPPPRTCLSGRGGVESRRPPRCLPPLLPYQAYDSFEGREGPMRLAPKLAE